MSRHWVVNASPSILLGKIGKLSLLTQLSENCVLPLGVATEILAGDDDDAAKIWVQSEGEQYIHDVTHAPSVLAWGLGIGETEVLSRCLKTGEEAIIDDGQARKCATSFNIKVRGTLGVILLAKREHLIPAAKPLLNDLVKAGFRIRDDVLKVALTSIGE